MNPIVQNLTAEVGTSITTVMLETPLWETPWHQHEEIELCLVVKGSGKVFIGNYMGDYQKNDVFLIGSNLPHLFRKDADESIRELQLKEPGFTANILLKTENKEVEETSIFG